MLLANFVIDINNHANINLHDHDRIILHHINNQRSMHAWLTTG